MPIKILIIFVIHVIITYNEKIAAIKTSEKAVKAG